MPTAFVFNTTWDKHERAWKAGQFCELKRDAPYYAAGFHARLARRLEELGIATERTKHGWEVAGIPASAVRKFSRRTEVIEAEAKRKGITDAKQKAELGAKTRQRKQKELSVAELQAEWSARLSPGERAAIVATGERIGGRAAARDAGAAGKAVAHAIAHGFERGSVLPERTLLAEAMKHAVGKATPEEVERAMRAQDLVFGERNGQRMVTTREVLAEEMRMLAFARDGRGTAEKLGHGAHRFKRDWLNAGQRQAVCHVLESRDRVMLIRGAAGVGKTSMMQEAVEAIEAGGRRVFTFAPSAEASRGILRGEGFANADTVASLLTGERRHAEIKGQVIWIDEAGQLSSKSMLQVFDLADRLDARVILSGDKRQHGSVERGAALRLLEEEAGLLPAEIVDIQRQKGSYKQAVHALSEGRTEAGFAELDRLGWIKEVADEDRYKALAAEYVGTVEAGKSALVVSPTHREGGKIVAEIRDALKARGRIDPDERPVLQLESLSLTEAQRGDNANYTAGDVLEFHQNAVGYGKGERIVAGGTPLPLSQAARFQAFRPGELRLAAGDLVRITRNGTTADGKHRLNNGARYTVTGFTPSGDLVLDNGWKVSREFGLLDHGYVATSHASQGKTVDRVIISVSPESFPASSREQFYVSVSRGRQRATIYTGDKRALLAAITRSDDRLTATEFVTMRRRQRHGAQLQGREATVAAGRDDRKQEREGLGHER